MREGWFHAHRLLAPALDAGEREAVDRAYEQLVRGRARSFAEHTELERQLVTALTKPCRRLVVGYAVKDEYFSDEVSRGRRKHRLRRAERAELRRLHSHRKVEGLPLERQAAPGRA